MTALNFTAGKFRAFNAAGTAPLAGGKLYTYFAGTTSPKASYTDAINYVANANPVILDANGEADVWLDGAYKLVLKDSTDVTQWTEDYVRLTDAKDINTQTDNYTLVVGDAFKIVEMNKATAVNLTIPPNSSVAFSLGTEIDVTQYGAGQVTLVAGAGVTIRTNETLKSDRQYAKMKLYQRATNEWILSGEVQEKSIVNVTTATLAVTRELHEGRVMTLNKADGITATLPAASGSGDRYRFIVGTTITSVGGIIQVANASDTMAGLVVGLDDDGVPANAWTVGTTDDTFTMDGSTKGGIVGDEIELIDIAANLWFLRAGIKQSGTEATPMSAVV